MKWPLQPHFGLTASPISGLSFGNDSRSPPSAENQPLHYSPLQQNTDRAVSPHNVNFKFGMPSVSFVSTASAEGVGCDKYDDTNTSNQSMEAEGDDLENDTMKHLKQMSTKTLTNLASYENPKQKCAQKILSAARSAPVSSGRTRVDQVSVGSCFQTDGAGGETTNTMTYRSILAKGPGAPQPLTAGPPGLRQPKGPAIEHATAVRQILYSAKEFSLAQLELRRSLSIDQCQTVSRECNSRKTYTVTPIQETLHTDRNSSAKIFDTLSPDEARKYYGKGQLPTNFNYEVQALSFFGGQDLRKGRHHLFPCSREALAAHNFEIDGLWSEGTAMITKSMDQAILEQKHRHFERFNGCTVEEKRKLPHKVDNPVLSIQEANSIPTCEHSKYLLSMAFQTLIALETFTLSGNLPKLEYREL